MAVRLALDLLGRGARAHEAVKTRARAARDGHEQKRKHWIAGARRRRRQRGLHDLEAAEEDADDARANREVEHEAAEVTARLQERPDRRHRRDEAVREDQHRPGARPERDHRRPLRAEPHRDQRRRHEDHRGEPQRRLQEALDEAEHHREHHVQERGHRDGAARVPRALLEPRELDVAGHERRRGDVGERDDHVDQRQPDEHSDREPRLLTELRADDLGDRLAAMAHRRDQRGEVVHRADQDHAEADPQQRRQPAELLPSHDRTGDRARRRDRRKVLAEQVERTRRDEVDAVVDRDGRRHRVRIQLVLAGDEAAVVAIAQIEQSDNAGREQGQAHGPAPYTNYG
jgi:hypothetical protein